MESQSSRFSNEQVKFNNNNTSVYINDQQSSNPLSSHVDSCFSPNTNSILYSFSFAELIDFHKKRTRRHTKYLLMGIGIFSLIGLLLLIISFCLPNCDDYRESCSDSKSTLLVIGPTILGTGILTLLIAICYTSYQFGEQFSELDDTENRQQPVIWRLDGEEWIRYLNYIYGPKRGWIDADPLSSFCCRRSSYGRLINRQHGHIVWYGNGFVIDELYFISFRQYSLQGVQILSAGEHQQIIGLRIHTYLKAGKNKPKCYFDVFAPSSVPVEQIQSLARPYNGQIAVVNGYDITRRILRVVRAISNAYC